MRELVPLLVAVSCCAVGISAIATPCPKSPGFRPSDEAREKCEQTIDESLDECRQYVDSLLDIDKLTDQQRFDLANWLSFLSWSESVESGKEFRHRSLQEYRTLHKKFPDDVQVMWGLALEEDDETSLQFQRRIAQLAPDCNINNHYFAVELDRRIGHGWDRAEQDEELVQEFVSLLNQGYEHAEGRWHKMHFGHLRYREYLLAGDQDLAEIFWNQVVAEIDPGSFPQDNTYSYGWGLLCGDMGFKFRFAEICLDTIEQTLKEALESDTHNVDYAMAGASELANKLVLPEYIGPSVLLPGPPDVHEVSFRPYRAEEGARILIRLRGLLESVPKDSRTSSFERTYKYVLGRKQITADFKEEDFLELVPSPSDPGK